MIRGQAPVIVTKQATVIDVSSLVPMFDRYRQFYQQPSDEDLARKFLTERLDRDESVIFYATVNDNPAGFLQLFPSFSSAAAQRTFILNDLYVMPQYRRIYVASYLLKAASDFAKTEGAVRMSLATGIKNAAAGALYKKHGWRESKTFKHFVISLES